MKLLSRMKFGPLKIVSIVIIILGLYSTYIRFFYGLGASTNLSDEVPWGLWMGFNILSGVVLASGGFTICAIYYIFNIKLFKPAIRSSILVAYISYLLVIIALVYELGRPEKIFNIIVLWNPRSVLFEVAWCVILYTIVLTLEFGPTIIEKFKGLKTSKILQLINLPLVIAGAILSILHQSSLGALYLIVQGKLYELWYSSLLPIFFFISSLTVGCAIIIIISQTILKKSKKELELDLLINLTKFMVVLIIINIIVKIFDLVDRDVFSLIIKNRVETYFYWSEVITGLLIPLILFSVKTFRENKNGLFLISLFTIIGVIINRMNVSIIGFRAFSEVTYFPSFEEIIITMMLVTIGFITLKFSMKYLPVLSSKSEKD